MMKNNFIKILSFAGILSVFFVLGLSVLLFFCKITIGPMHLISGNIISFVVTGIIFKNFKKSFLAHLINFIILLILGVYFFSTKDFATDVLLYHLPALKLLLSGWNPVIVDTAYLPSHDWAKFFPKAIYIVEASIASAFGSIESSKLLSTFLIYVSSLFAYTALRAYIEKEKICCIVLAFCAGFNTVSMLQNFTFLVDGCLSSLLVIFISSIALYIKTKDKSYLYVFAASMCLAANTKLCASAYLLIIGIGAVYFVRKDLPYIKTFIAGLFLSIVVIGFNPYMINTIKHHNPFYPIGSKDVQIVENFAPKEISDKFYLTKFAVSLFSEITGTTYETPKLKIPFSVTEKDIKVANCPQPLMSGYGTFFSGVLILTILAMILARRKEHYKDFLIVQGIVAVSVFINPECWWARFVPQFYLLGIITACYLLMNDSSGNSTVKYKAAAYILTFAILLNTTVTGFFHYKKVFEHQRAQNELTYLLQRFKGKIYINGNDPRIEGIRIKLNDFNIRYEEKNEEECSGKKLKYATIPMCLVP